MDYRILTPICVVIVVAGIAGVTDAWKFKVYNVVTLPLIVTGVVFHGIMDGYAGFTYSMVGVSFGFIILLVPYILGAVGAGDVKLMAGVGAWLGPGPTAYVFLIAAILGAAYAAILMIRHGGFRHSLASVHVLVCQISALGKYLGAEEKVESVVDDDDRRKRLIPFATMVAAGVILLTIWSRL